jgi:hypothetical protein
MPELTRHPTIWPRVINFLVGIWLIASAFAWPHGDAARSNTWIVGILIAIVAIGAMFQPVIRYANTLLAVWLFVASLAIHPTRVETVWNNLIAAVVVFALSLVPSAPILRLGRRPGPAHA